MNLLDPRQFTGIALREARYFWRRYGCRGTEREDFEATAMLSLVRNLAVHARRLTHGVQAFLAGCIKNDLSNFNAKERNYQRYRPADAPPEHIDRREPAPPHQAEVNDAIALIKAQLDADEFDLLLDYYGHETHAQEIAARQGVSRQLIQLRASTIRDRLRRSLPGLVTAPAPTRHKGPGVTAPQRLKNAPRWRPSPAELATLKARSLQEDIEEQEQPCSR
jgi:RNA polymerase sigma factor (sigma-70 family)